MKEHEFALDFVTLHLFLIDHSPIANIHCMFIKVESVKSKFKEILFHINFDFQWSAEQYD